jgi:hypothetical protein
MNGTGATLRMLPKVKHIFSHRARWFKAETIIAYSQGSLVRKPAGAPNILTEDFHDLPQYINENTGTGP